MAKTSLYPEYQHDMKVTKSRETDSFDEKSRHWRKVNQRIGSFKKIDENPLYLRLGSGLSKISDFFSRNYCSSCLGRAQFVVVFLVESADQNIASFIQAPVLRQKTFKF